MNDSEFLFNQKLQTLLALLLIISLTFLDKIIPPFGIPIAMLGVFALFRWRKLPIKVLGLFKPRSWRKTVLVGATVGISLQVFSVFVLVPLLESFGVTEEVPAFYKSIEGNQPMLIIYLIVSWTTAGFGEELIYRSFFLGQFVSFLGNSKYKWFIGLTLSSIIFGFLHYNNGIEAIIATGIFGFAFGMVYLKTTRNIWAAYIAHGVADTVGFLTIYFGFY